MSDARVRLRQLGQLDLAAWVEAGTGSDLWSIQRQIGQAVSRYRARVAVPSSNASGKSWLAARLALAFYDTYTPGTPCATCNGPCRGGKVITTSSTAEHLRNALWGEIRAAIATLNGNGVHVAGKLGQGQVLRVEDDPQHFIVGLSPNKAEAFQGYHAAHKLIIGDEATSLDDEMQQGIAGLLSTGDSRLLLIFNPTTADTYAAQECRNPQTEVIKIKAWDTPNFTGEAVPPGANLSTPEWLESLKSNGEGPGTYVWTTRVEAEFWDQGDDVLITPESYDRAFGTDWVPGTRALGVDMASYGTDENVIAYRDGNALTRLDAFHSMPMDVYWETKVAEAVRRHDPHYLVYDADGVGAGVIGYARDVVAKHNRNGGNLQLMPFRGAIKVSSKFLNARSAWLWSLRRHFEAGTISLQPFPEDPKLRTQAIDVRYNVTAAGDIQAETKERMRKRGTTSPDRLDAMYYAFSMVEELPIPAKIVSEPLTLHTGVQDNSLDAMWRRTRSQIQSKGGKSRTPWDRVPDGQGAWDDL